MAPFNPQAKEVLGLDVSSVPFLARALKQAVQTNKVVASKPFELAEGGRAYVLFKQLNKNTNVVASVLINTKELLKYTERHQFAGNVSLKYPDYQGNWLAESIGDTAQTTSFLGSYQFDYNFEELGQPFTLSVTYPIQFSDFNLLLSLVICLFSSAIFWLITRLQLTAFLLKKQLSQSHTALQKSIKQKERLFANISHELRTPLTLISAPIDNLLQDKNLNSTQQKMVALAQANSERLYELANRIIDLSSVENRPKAIEIIQVDDIAIRLQIAFGSLLNAKNITFNCSFHSNAIIKTDLADFTSSTREFINQCTEIYRSWWQGYFYQ